MSDGPVADANAQPTTNTSTNGTNGSTNGSTAAGEYVSREAYEAMQKMLNDAQQQNALFKARAERTDMVNANYISQNHEKIVEGLNILREDLKDSNNAMHVAPMCAWADNLAKTPVEQLDSEMSIAVTMCAASDRIKRGREAEASLKEKDEALSALYKERDEKNEQITKLQRSLTDMEELAKDRQKKAEELGLMMQRKLNYSAMHNFANPDSRFKEPASDAAKRAAESLQSKVSGKAPMEAPTSCATEVNNALGGNIGGLNTTVAVASAGGVATSGSSDPHAMFKTNASMLASMIESRGQGGSRFTPADSSHHLLGRAPPTAGAGSSTASMAEIAEAIKLY